MRKLIYIIFLMFLLPVAMAGNLSEDKGDHNLKIGEFYDNFNDNTEDWEGTGTGSLSSGRYYYQSIATGSNLSYNGLNWSNYTVSADVVLVSDLGAGITYTGLYARYNDYGRVGLRINWDGNNTIADKSGDVSYNTAIPQYNRTMNLSQVYNLKLKVIGSNISFWMDGYYMGSSTYNSANNATGRLAVLIRDGNSYWDNFTVRQLDDDGNVITSGNFTSWKNWTDGNVTYKIVVNATTPENTNYTILGRQNATGDFQQLSSSGLTGNTTLGIGAPLYENLDVRIQLFGNETATPELISVTYYAQAPVIYAPNITSWSNTKTNNNTANFTSNVSESVTFNATANQTIATWNWYVNGTNQNINYDNISLSYPTTGTRLIQINATNSNGTSNTISWNLTVQIPDTSTSWLYGIGGKFFQNNTIGSNNSCINQGDGAIGANCIFADNFADNNYNGWFINDSGTWTPNNGTINQTGANGYLVQNVTHTNAGVFTKFKEYGTLTSYMDVLRIRGNTTTNYQLSMGSPTTNRSSQYYFVYPSTWNSINASITKTRYLLDSNYVYNAVYGTNFLTYHSNVSYSGAMTTPLVIGSNSSLVSGTEIAFGGSPNASAIVSWDEIRAVELDALGNQYTQGNYSMNYTVPASQYAKNVTINGTYASGTNYSLKYRQNATGDYIAVEGVKTTDVTIELPTPYYQNIDMILEMNSTESNTLWITDISVGASATSEDEVFSSSEYVQVIII